MYCRWNLQTDLTAITLESLLNYVIVVFVRHTAVQAAAVWIEHEHHMQPACLRSPIPFCSSWIIVWPSAVVCRLNMGYTKHDEHAASRGSHSVCPFCTDWCIDFRQKKTNIMKISTTIYNISSQCTISAAARHAVSGAGGALSCAFDYKIKPPINRSFIRTSYKWYNIPCRLILFGLCIHSPSI